MDPMTLMMLMGQGKSAMGGLFNGLFGNAGEPYDKANKELGDFWNRATGFQRPYQEAGQNAIPQFQQWLQGMQDPSGFINKLMGGYQESPFAKFQQQQGVRAAQNMGSASGLTGSTPLMQFAQQNAQNISSQDMQDWLGKVLGINTQYGAGLGNLISGGQGSANSLSNLSGQFGQDIAKMAYGKSEAERQQRGGIWGGLFG